MKLTYRKLKTQAGTLKLVASETALVAVLWGDETRVKLGHVSKDSAQNPLLDRAEKELSEYFQNKRKSFTIPLDPQGTAFQRRVWNQLNKIPYGATISYRDLAKKIGSPQAARAAGSATGKNPISIIVPCHRVVGSNGKLTGFAGGLKAKKILLDLERSDSVSKKVMARNHERNL